MTRVDFYVLPDHTTEARYEFTCKLIEKAVRHKNKVMVWAPTEQAQKMLDDGLWTFKPESFLPHELRSKLSPTPEKAVDTDESVYLPNILISHQKDDPSHHDLLINLSGDIPPMFSRFQRLAEVVVQQEIILKQTREHYSFLRERGYPINMHKL